MTDAHCDRLIEKHGHAVARLPIHVLDIPDEYRLMDPELIECLRESAGPILKAAVAEARGA